MEDKNNLMARVISLIFCLLGSFTLTAQFTYTLNNSVVVKDEQGQPLKMPWAGGLNGGQYNIMDLNGDDKPDLVMFDRMADKAFTFINENNQYTYAPYYEDLLPADLQSWVLLRDYNGDGRKDLFTRATNNEGFILYTNTTESGAKLSWKPFYFTRTSNGAKTTTVQTKGLSNYVNMQLAYDDLPSIEDMDGDGDLDILVISYSGTGTIEYHKNFSERYNTLDSIDFELQTKTWGGITECTCGTFAFNGADCASTAAGRIEHAGGKSLLAIDADGDSDLDLLFSEASCQTLYLLKNEGTNENPIFNSGAKFPTLNSASMEIFPAGYYEDVDFDGKRDLIVSPNIYTKGTDLVPSPRLEQSNWFYKNTGTDVSPVFALQTKSFLQEEMIDLGDESSPAFADEDGDGDLDLFVSENFNNDTYTSLIYFYENTGTSSDPEFTLRDKDYLGFSNSTFYAVKIQFADLNADGKTDLTFLASKHNDFRPVLYFLPNTASSGLSFSGNYITTNIILSGYGENIHITDVGGGDNDKPDGKLDVLVGRNGGAMEYWVNNGSVNNFSLKDDTFLGLNSSIRRQNPICATGDLDGDGYVDLLLTDKSGTLRIISNYHAATDISSAVTDIVVNPLLDSAVVARNYGGTVWPAIANLFNESTPAVILGNRLGGLILLENITGKEVNNNIEIYPNPVLKDDILNVKVNSPCTLQVFTSIGQRINTPVNMSEFGTNTIRMSDLTSGLYFFKFTFSNKSVTKRVAVN